MKLVDSLNRADVLVREAAELHSQGNEEATINKMVDLRQHMNEPIESDTPEDEDTSENCTLCGKPKE